jgi:hypothetical protein
VASGPDGGSLGRCHCGNIAIIGYADSVAVGENVARAAAGCVGSSFDLARSRGEQRRSRSISRPGSARLRSVLSPLR